MTTPRRSIPLTLLALVVIGGAIAIGLAGQGASKRDHAAAGIPAGRATEQKAGSRSGKPARSTELLEAAAEFALAARNWTPATYRRSWERQVTLAGGRYARALKAARPTDAEVAELRADRSYSRARLIEARRDKRVRGPHALVIVTLDETTVATGQTIEGQTVNQVRLRRRGEGWTVVDWTVLPGGYRPE